MNETEKLLRSLEKKWEEEGKSADAKKKLRYYYRNRERLNEEKRSLKLPRGVKLFVRSASL